MLQFLIEKGARLDVENAKQWTPLFAAEGVVYASSGIRRYPDAATLLRKAMLERGIPIDDAGRLLNRPKPVIAPGSIRTIASGVFTREQATRGQLVYRRACAACHLETLGGDSVSPPLVGPGFLNRYSGTDLQEVVGVIRGSMPQNAPDSLGDQAYVDLVSYLLSVNGQPAGERELPIDVTELGRILVPAHKPAP